MAGLNYESVSKTIEVPETFFKISENDPKLNIFLNDPIDGSFFLIDMAREVPTNNLRSMRSPLERIAY